jgi:protein-tyrosine-phosphatase
MAEGFFKRMLSKVNSKIKVSSAGITPYQIGHPPTAEAIVVMAEKGIDISKYHSKPVDILINEFDLILTMEKAQADFLKKRYPRLDIYNLKDFVNKMGDIDDPFLAPVETYRKCRNEIEHCLKKLLKVLVNTELENNFYE